MKRRKFIASSAATLGAGMTYGSSLADVRQDGSNELYELKIYDVPFARKRQKLLDYLKGVVRPAVKAIGARDLIIYKENKGTLPDKYWAITVYPDFGTYEKGIALAVNEDFIAKSKDYMASGPIYDRISSSLLYAFDGWKQWKEPTESAKIFEVRVYESANEDALRRKIKMFNDEEIELFAKVDLNPTFFGKMLTGPWDPCLVYMLSFRDMDHRAKAWSDFVAHQDWNVMKDKEIYKDTISNIHNYFMELV